MVNAEKAKPARKHVAGWARDKLHGGYLIRVVGPHATAFAGRTVPVTRNDGTESEEKLTKLIASGIDDGKVNAANKGQPWALYQYEEREREQQTIEF